MLTVVTIENLGYGYSVLNLKQISSDGFETIFSISCL